MFLILSYLFLLKIVLSHLQFDSAFFRILKMFVWSDFWEFQLQSINQLLLAMLVLAHIPTFQVRASSCLIKVLTYHLTFQEFYIENNLLRALQSTELFEQSHFLFHLLTCLIFHSKKKILQFLNSILQFFLQVPKFIHLFLLILESFLSFALVLLQFQFWYQHFLLFVLPNQWFSNTWLHFILEYSQVTFTSFHLFLQSLLVFDQWNLPLLLFLLLKFAIFLTNSSPFD